MKIAVFGFYNSLNAGDDRLQACITRIVRPGGTVVFMPHQNPPCLDYLRGFDWILIGGGGLVFERVGIWENLRKWARKSKARISVVGLGVNRIGPELIREMTDLLDVASFFYVRDNRSKELLNSDPRVEVWPDITQAFPVRRNLFLFNPKLLAINLSPCHWKTFDPDAWIEESSRLDTTIPFPFYFTPSQDYGLLRKFFGDAVPTEFTLDPLNCAHTLLACRFHAIVFAMQMRIPFIAISYDDKVRRLAADAGLGDYCLETSEHLRLRSTFERLNLELQSVANRIDSYALEQESLATELVNRMRRKMSIVAADFP